MTFYWDYIVYSSLEDIEIVNIQRRMFRPLRNLSHM